MPLAYTEAVAAAETAVSSGADPLLSVRHTALLYCPCVHSNNVWGLR